MVDLKEYTIIRSLKMARRIMEDRDFMKRRSLFLILTLTAALTVAGCGKDDKSSNNSAPAPSIQVVTENPTVTTEVSQDAAAPVEESREGMYRSELTNEWIDEALKDQRPIAAMVDNEKTALPHYGLSRADIVYEMTNSTLNDGVTRFMVLFKDYESIDQIGSIRSVRPTNLIIAPEWDAIVCHDGGPFYIDDYIAKPYLDHFSGTFSRVDNGKSREFTEYILKGDMDKNFSNSSVSKTYTSYYKGQNHFLYAPEAQPQDLSGYADAKSASHIQLPYKHNKPYLDYDESSQKYLYSEYGQAHVDPGNGNQQLAFDNVILQSARLHKFDDNGYMMFYAMDVGKEGYYITKGKAIKIVWTKPEDACSPTKYYDADGNEIVINTGKTYIAIIPDDIYSGLTID